MTEDDGRRLSELTVGDAKRILVYGTVTLLALALFLLLVGKVLVALLLGVVAGAYLLPVQEWLERRLRARAGSAVITIILIVVPLVGVVGYGWYEMSGHARAVSGKRDAIAASISQALADHLPFTYENTNNALKGALAEAVVRSGEAVDELRKGSALLLASTAIFFFTVFYVLTQRTRIVSWIKLRVPGEYMPLYEELAKNVGGALHGALWAVFIDQTFKAVVIFVCNLVFNVPLAVALALAAFLVGFFPLLGVWVVYIPICVYLLVFRDQPTAAAIYFLIGTTLTLASSFFLRPFLAASQTRDFNFYWMLLALVAGVFVFGVPGIVLGPSILGFTKAVADTMFGDVRYETSLLKEEREQAQE
ncbi:MAG TPA: AI-2E family transporter [Pyrinomonadaceae bacterium]|jgi:predicted PurR-regulated permease PerM